MNEKVQSKRLYQIQILNLRNKHKNHTKKETLIHEEKSSNKYERGDTPYPIDVLI